MLWSGAMSPPCCLLAQYTRPSPTGLILYLLSFFLRQRGGEGLVGSWGLKDTGISGLQGVYTSLVAVSDEDLTSFSMGLTLRRAAAA